MPVVFDKLNFSNILSGSSIILACVLIAVCLSLRSEHRKFDNELVKAKQQYEQNFPDAPQFSTSGAPTIYEFLADKYENVFILMIVFLTGKVLLIKQEFATFSLKPISYITCFSSLAFAFNQLWKIFGAKSDRREYLFTWDEPIDRVMRSAVPWDWLCLIIVGVLLLSELISIFVSKRKRAI